MAGLPYRLLAVLSSEAGIPIGEYPITPDWHPATESARFLALRQSKSLVGPERIVPVWDADGAPHLSGVQAVVCNGDGRDIPCDIPLAYFKSQVQSVSSRCIEEGKLKVGETFHYRIAAFACSAEEAADGPGQPQGWHVQQVPSSPLCGERPLKSFLGSSRLIGGSEETGDYPVFIPLSVLQQAEALKEEANVNETGGILIGYLWRDTESPEVFAEVTALVPALHTIAQSTRLTFTPATWDAVRAAILLRNREEVFLAWHHTHPSRFWCTCGPELQRHCPLGQQFFSSDDKSVHRTVFSLGFHTALVTGDRPLPDGGWEIVHALYGWRSGIIEPRGFYLLD